MSSFLLHLWRGLSGFQTSQGDNSRWPPQTSSTSPWHRCMQTWFMGRTSLSFIHILVRGILCHRHIATHLALSFKLWNHRFLDKGSILWKGNSDLCGDRRQAKQPVVCRPAHQRTQVLIFWALLLLLHTWCSKRIVKFCEEILENVLTVHEIIWGSHCHTECNLSATPQCKRTFNYWHFC